MTSTFNFTLDFPGDRVVKSPPANAGNVGQWGRAGEGVQSLGLEDPLEKEMATHSSVLAYKVPWTEELSGLHSPWGHKELDITEQLSTHMSPLFCSGL